MQLRTQLPLHYAAQVQRCNAAGSADAAFLTRTLKLAATRSASTSKARPQSCRRHVITTELLAASTGLVLGCVELRGRALIRSAHSGRGGATRSLQRDFTVHAWAAAERRRRKESEATKPTGVMRYKTFTVPELCFTE